jgi:membrane-bound ClpP family serine protease
MGETGFVQHKRGHNAIMTGLCLMVIGGILAVATALDGFGILVAVAGLVTLLIGFGMRRETPA